MALLLSRCHTLIGGEIVLADVRLADGRIEAIGDLSTRDCEVMDASGHIVIPGLRNTHMHAATSLIQGMPVHGRLDDWVDCLWRFEQGITSDEAYWGALWSCTRMLRSGITFFEDMHFHEVQVAQACAHVGIRASLSEALMDAQPWEAPSSIRSSLDLARQVADSDTLTAKMGIVSVRMTSDELVSSACEAVQDNPGMFDGFHLHIDEIPADRVVSMQRYGLSPTEYFFKKGMLHKGSTVAHYVHPSQGDIRIMASSCAEVSHCPGSNMMLSSGTAPLGNMLSAGVPISLGIDSPSIHDGYSLWGDVRGIALSHRLSLGDALSLLCGSTGIRVGDNADLVLLKKEHAFPYRNMPQALVYGMTDAAVDHVFVGGRHVLSQGKVTTVDEERCHRRALGAAQSAWSRLEC